MNCHFLDFAAKYTTTVITELLTCFKILGFMSTSQHSPSQHVNSRSGRRILFARSLECYDSSIFKETALISRKKNHWISCVMKMEPNKRRKYQKVSHVLQVAQVKGSCLYNVSSWVPNKCCQKMFRSHATHVWNLLKSTANGLRLIDKNFHYCRWMWLTMDWFHRIQIKIINC